MTPDYLKGHIVVVDLTTGSRTLASTSPGGFLTSPSLSADGSRVAFQGTVTSPQLQLNQVNVRDLAQSAPVLVLQNQAGQAKRKRKMPSDGRYTTKDRAATNLLAEDTDALDDVLLKDLSTGSPPAGHGPRRRDQVDHRRWNRPFGVLTGGTGRPLLHVTADLREPGRHDGPLRLVPQAPRHCLRHHLGTTGTATACSTRCSPREPRLGRLLPHFHHARHVREHSRAPTASP